MIKKTITILALLFFVATASAQISVSSRHVGKAKKFSNNELEKFKNTTTVFVLSDIFEKDEYKKILDKSWTITPYVISNDFDKKDYLDGKHSFVELRGLKKIKTMKSGAKVTYLYMYLDIFMYDIEALKKALKKKKGAKQKKINKIFRKHQIPVSRIELFPTSDFILTALTEENEVIIKDVYTKDCFYTYELGFLQNIFQKVNSLIKKEEIYWMYEDDYTAELKNLKHQTLFVPSYMKTMYNPFRMKDSNKRLDKVIEAFSEYAYKYEFQEDEVLNERILNGEEFYYLRYSRTNSQKFIHIVNSKTGEIIYRNYETGLAYNIKGKHFKALNKTIKKALKK